MSYPFLDIIGPSGTQTRDSLGWPYLSGVLLVLGMLAIVWTFAKPPSSRLPLPPGPTPLPIVGNLLEMPTEQPWLVYDSWFKKYNSDIIHFNVVGQPVVVIGSAKRCFDLFDKRSAIYSDRPRLPMILEFTFAAMIMDVSYGVRVLEKGDPYILTAEEAFSSLNAATVPGTYLVDLFPVLKHIPSWLPGAGFKRLAEHAAKVNTGKNRAEEEEIARNCAAVSYAAVSHASMADDEYDGYFIPKGSIVVGSILHDPVMYPKPFDFNPDRFLKDGVINPEVRHPNQASFGFGRRMCPGRFFSDSSLYIIVASTLSVFSIQPPLDEQGNPVSLDVVMTTGLLS
ncbi:hypothetical protein EYR36_011811 [Pleurotus pulmonarius]|nr:hypothetical protein EYR36_011811 [Pleurotus pulmonarius]